MGHRIQLKQTSMGVEGGRFVLIYEQNNNTFKEKQYPENDFSSSSNIVGMLQYLYYKNHYIHHIYY